MYVDTFELRRYNIRKKIFVLMWPDMHYLYFFSHTTIFTTCERMIFAVLLPMACYYRKINSTNCSTVHIYMINEDGEIYIYNYIYNILSSKHYYSVMYSVHATFIRQVL